MDFLSGSFKIGRISRIDIRVHFLMVIWVAINLFQSGGGDALKSEALFMALLFGIILLHEFGHCFGARSVGGDADTILMWPLGGLAFARAPMRAWPQFVTVICGPLVNVALCILSGAVLSYFSGGLRWFALHPFEDGSMPRSAGPWFFYLYIFFKVNYWLLLFNLLPIYPMDGGQLLHTLLWPFMGLRNSLMLACQIGIGGAIVIGFWGLQSKQPITFLIALVGVTTCWQRYQAAKAGLVVEDVDFRVYRPRDRRDGVFRRLFGWPSHKPGAQRRSPTTEKTPPSNPNPGGWDAKVQAERAMETEVDRILTKVHEQGIGSLSYVERQTLEHATRARQASERDA